MIREREGVDLRPAKAPGRVGSPRLARRAPGQRAPVDQSKPQDGVSGGDWARPSGGPSPRRSAPFRSAPPASAAQPGGRRYTRHVAEEGATGGGATRRSSSTTAVVHPGPRREVQVRGLSRGAGRCTRRRAVGDHVVGISEPPGGPRPGRGPGLGPAHPGGEDQLDGIVPGGPGEGTGAEASRPRRRPRVSGWRARPTVAARVGFRSPSEGDLYISAPFASMRSCAQSGSRLGRSQ